MSAKTAFQIETHSNKILMATRFMHIQYPEVITKGGKDFYRRKLISIYAAYGLSLYVRGVHEGVSCPFRGRDKLV